MPPIPFPDELNPLLSAVSIELAGEFDDLRNQQGRPIQLVQRGPGYWRGSFDLRHDINISHEPDALRVAANLYLEALYADNAEFLAPVVDSQWQVGDSAPPQFAFRVSNMRIADGRLLADRQAAPSPDTQGSPPVGAMVFLDTSPAFPHAEPTSYRVMAKATAGGKETFTLLPPRLPRASDLTPYLAPTPRGGGVAARVDRSAGSGPVFSKRDEHIWSGITVNWVEAD